MIVLTVLNDENTVKSVDEVDAFVGGRVRFRRVTIGMSQEHLGNAIGLTFQQVQKYEKGLNRIGAGRLYRIAKVLTVPVEFFYDGLPSTTGDGCGGEAVDTRSAEIQAFLSTAEGQQLAHAFQRIPDGPTRRRIIDLVNTISDYGV